MAKPAAEKNKSGPLPRDKAVIAQSAGLLHPCASVMADTSSISNDARTTQSLIRDLERLRDVLCAGCGQPVGLHQVLMAVAIGFKDSPRCLSCLGAAWERPPVQLRDWLFDYIRQRQCYLDAWNWLNRAAGLGEGVMPPSLQSLDSSAGSQITNGARLCPKDQPQHSRASEPAAAGSATTAALRTLHAHAEWDAGEMGCGDLVLELRLRLQSMPPDNS
jgi:hypothetical protein